MDRATDRPQAPGSPADPTRASDYDGFAEAYAADNEQNVQNAYYERPAMLALAGDVAGRRILDAGCGAHYLRDWGPTLAEMRRVLRPGGRLIASVQHPFADYLVQDPRPDYFATTDYTDESTFGGRTVRLRFWRRPLHAMTDAFTAAGSGA